MTTGSPPPTGLRARLLGSANALFRHSDWTVGVVRRPIREVLTSRDIGPVAWMPPRRGRYAADPFGRAVGDVVHVLFEDFDQRTGRGTIGLATVDRSGTWSEPETVLDTGSHASYPYLLDVAGETFLIPETADTSEVRLYRAAEFPHGWRLEATLLRDVQVSDATVINRDGRWWMFGTSRGRGVNEALRIWHAPELTGPWRLHAVDPVKVDPASSRPGGTPFVVNGGLYRPAQDCSHRYGRRLVINRVEALDAMRYAETTIRLIDAIQPNDSGLHTLSAAGAVTLLDGNRVRFVPEALQLTLKARLRRADQRNGES